MFNWMRNLLVRKTKPLTNGRRATRNEPRCRMWLERLEDRLAPANNITILTGGSLVVPVGATTFADTNDYTIDPLAINAAVATVNLRANVNIAFMNAVSIAGVGVGLNAQALRNITVSAGAGIFTPGGGDITLLANQGATATPGNFNGIDVNGATITTTSGNVLLQGKGGDSGNNNYGVAVLGFGVVTAGGSGSVTVQGTGGPSSGNSNYGVIVFGTGSQITSGGGAVSVTGQGGGSGFSGNFGVFVDAG